MLCDYTGGRRSYSAPKGPEKLGACETDWPGRSETSTRWGCPVNGR